MKFNSLVYQYYARSLNCNTVQGKYSWGLGLLDKLVGVAIYYKILLFPY